MARTWPLTRHPPLRCCCVAQDGWLLDRQTVSRYLTAVEKLYKPNPYHNKTHAADVTQTAGVILTSLDRHLSGGCSSCSSSSLDGSGGCNSHSSSARGVAACSSTGAADGSTCCGRRAAPGLSKLERFSVILASAVHDLGHPGVNNAFLIRSRDAQALAYNDRSVNEMMHASLAFRLAAEDPALDIFAAFPQAEYETVRARHRRHAAQRPQQWSSLAAWLAGPDGVSPVLLCCALRCAVLACQMRKLVLEMVLSTDMDVHFALLKRFDDAVAAAPDVTAWTSLEQRSLLFQMVVHLADLANPSRPWHLALTWAEWVVTEFMAQVRHGHAHAQHPPHSMHPCCNAALAGHAPHHCDSADRPLLRCCCLLLLLCCQGEREASVGIPVSDMCNASKVCMPAAQLFFIERFMQPTLEAFRPAAPSFYALAMPWLADTKAKWGVFKAAGVMLPCQAYPALPPPPPGSSPLAAVLGDEPACCRSNNQQQPQQLQQSPPPQQPPPPPSQQQQQ